MNVLPIGLAGAAAVAAILGRGILVHSSTLLAPSIWQGRLDRPTIALTFDDGPSESTPQLLDILDLHQVKATFFQCGVNVCRLPEVSREIVARGHELANHTYSHPHLCFRSPWLIHRELAKTQQIIQEVTGTSPRLFRPPFGLRGIGLRRAQKRLGLMGVMWSTVGFDWVWPAERIIDRLLAGARNGAIFCLHDGRELRTAPNINPTLEAVQAVLPVLQANGFHFETVSQLISHGKCSQNVAAKLVKNRRTKNAD